ncbi:MAG TPA: hypothetical protein VIJ16_02000, partial [Gemmatimonadaceae bacterium]
MNSETERNMARALAVLEPTLQRVAHRLTNNRDLRDDLLQEARIYLWRMDPSRFDLRNVDEVRYVQRELVARMWRVWKAEMR